MVIFVTLFGPLVFYLFGPLDSIYAMDSARINLDGYQVCLVEFGSEAARQYLYQQPPTERFNSCC